MRPPNERNPGGAGGATGVPESVHGQAHDGESRPKGPRLQVLARHLHGLGERALFEFLLEIIDAHGPEVIERLERYRRLDPEMTRQAQQPNDM